MRLFYSTLSLAVLALAGCSSAPRVPEYACPLNVSEQAKCATMKESLDASRNINPNSKTQSVFDPNAARSNSAAPSTSFAPSFSPNPTTLQSDPNGSPVFSQPKVYRPWVPAYTDSDGVLRADQYLYFNSPGRWNYGSLRSPGAAASNAPFEPVRPATRNTKGLGVNIVEPSTSANSPAPRPTTTQPSPAYNAPTSITQPAQAVAIPSNPPTAASPDNITPPRQRFSAP